MRLLQYPLTFLTMTLLIALMERTSIAFTITPQQPGASISYDREDEYQYSGGTGKTELNPPSITLLPLGGTTLFLSKLRRTFPDWTFNPAPSDQELDGSFRIQVYDASGTSSAVGAYLKLKYITRSALGDPTPENNELHWIQWVVNNYNITNNPGYGNLESVIDRAPGNSTPFYDVGAANGTDEDDFVDFAQRPTPQNNINWSAQLYLVELTAPKTATIYNGISWGWKNTFSGGSGGGGVESASTNISAKRELPILNTYSGDTSQLPQAVPESDSALGILAIGGWFGATWFSKRKKSRASLTDKPKIK